MGHIVAGGFQNVQTDTFFGYGDMGIGNWGDIAKQWSGSVACCLVDDNTRLEQGISE